ncbi:MAG: pyrimidine dimer DNA glycosylase [Thermoplasmata archaeon]|nr:MAG: pyrimidine dimer DNA glycosylase [Thermoplasmata archaeon]
MRVWDILPEKLCRNHLLGEHNEIHVIWNIITQDKKGYSNHPETKRWKGKLKALFNRHENIALEMVKRGFEHNSPLDLRLASGKELQNQFVDSIMEQIRILKEKKCGCKV